MTGEREWLRPAGTIGATAAAPVDARVRRVALGVLFPWLLMVLSFSLFTFLRAFADELGPAARADYVLRFDRALGAGTLPTIHLQDWLQTPWLTMAARLIHVSYFAFPVLLAAALSGNHRNRPRLLRYTTALALAFAIGLAGYLAIPTVPPWMADHDVSMLLMPGLDPESRGRPDPNPVAAMPSLHVAVACITGLAASNRRLAPAVVYTTAMSVALVYLGEHFVLDAVAGAALGIVCWSLAGRLSGGGEDSASGKAG